MKIFAIFQPDGQPSAFYNDNVYKPEDIPSEAVEISADQWWEFLENPGDRRWDGSGVAPFDAPAPVPTTEEVDAERDRRIASGFTFGGNIYQARDGDIRNINGASTAAAVAIMNGSLPGDLRWSDPSQDFGWIAADNKAQ
jgi:hypothetical protein